MTNYVVEKDSLEVILSRDAHISKYFVYIWEKMHLIFCFVSANYKLHETLELNAFQLSSFVVHAKCYNLIND